MTFSDQVFGILAIDTHAFALTIRAVGATDIGAFVPIQTQPAQAVENGLFRFRRAAGLVGIFDAQQKLAAMLTGKAQIKQCDVSSTYVRIAGGRRCNARTNSHGVNLLSKKIDEDKRPALYAMTER